MRLLLTLPALALSTLVGAQVDVVTVSDGASANGSNFLTNPGCLAACAEPYDPFPDVGTVIDAPHTSRCFCGPDRTVVPLEAGVELSTGVGVLGLENTASVGMSVVSTFSTTGPGVLRMTFDLWASGGSARADVDVGADGVAIESVVTGSAAQRVENFVVESGGSFPVRVSVSAWASSGFGGYGSATTFVRVEFIPDTPAPAVIGSFGAGCAGAGLSAVDVVEPGRHVVALTSTGGFPDSVTGFGFGLDVDSIPLPFDFAQGCSLYTNFIVAGLVPTDANGVATATTEFVSPLQWTLNAQAVPFDFVGAQLRTSNAVSMTFVD